MDGISIDWDDEFVRWKNAKLPLMEYVMRFRMLQRKCRATPGDNMAVRDETLFGAMQ
jgi:hypothetical protein